MTTTLTGPAGGTWLLVDGGMTKYCTVGQHFTTGPCWAYAVGIDLHRHVCAECAEKEDTRG